MRPVYETPETQAVERQMAEALERAWKCQMRKLPIAYHLDYAAVRDNRVCGWIELKRRHRLLADHHCFFLSAQKVMSADRLNRISGMPAVYVVMLDCGTLYYADILRQPYLFEFRGRTDRDDWQDQEPVIVIPIGEFRPVSLREVV